MRTSNFLASAVLALCAGAASAQTLESAAFEARGAFLAAQAMPGEGLRTAQIPGLHAIPLNPARPPYDAKSVASEGTRLAPQAGPAYETDLKGVLNVHLKGQLSVTLGGKKAFVSGVFDREQNAFLSVFIEGESTPLLFNIKGLLDKEGSIQAGSVGYKLYLEANALSPLKSKIAFENKANEDDVQTIRLGNLLNAIEASGQAVQLTGQSYRLFYFNDVQESGGTVVLNPNSRTVALILKDGEDMHVFLIPEETLPADKLAVFKVYKDKRIGVQNAGGKLRIYEL